jgi:Tat protein translocase TatB subunit
MFGIGPMEVVVILLVALLVLGPKRLPEVMKMLGRGLAQLKKTAEDVKREIVEQEDMKEIQDSLREISEVPRMVQTRLEREVEDLAREQNQKQSEDKSGDEGNKHGEKR